jgi:hypothetical protein
VFSNRM